MWTINHLFENTVVRTPEATALVDPGTGVEYTYSDLDEEVDRVAAGLQARDVGVGTRVGICLPNTVEHVLLALAIQRIGAVAVPFDYRVDGDAFHSYVSAADPHLLAFGDSVADVVRDGRDSLSCRHFVSAGDRSLDGVPDFEDLRADASESVTGDVSPDDLSVVHYATGATGDPEGVMLTQRAGVNRVLTNVQTQRRYDRETTLATLPLYTTAGLHVHLLSIVATSGTYVPVAGFDPEWCVGAIDQYDVTVLHEGPHYYEAILDAADGDRSAFESVDVAVFSGSAMDEDLLERVVHTIDPECVYNAYGMTEMVPPYPKVNLRDREDSRVFGAASDGDPMRVVEVGSADPAREVATGEEGELVVSMDVGGAFDGYWNQPEDHARIVDGWYFSGDACVRTANDEYLLTGPIEEQG